MLLLSCKDLSRGFDREPLFDGLDFELFAGERVGLVGPNGAGKTTLMRLLGGADKPDTGEVRRHAGARVALLQQVADFPPERTLYDEAKSALAELVAAQDEMIRVAEALAVAADDTERKSLSDRYDRLTSLLSTQDAYSIDHRIAQVLEGLGFREADYGRPVNSFSGGQQRRLLLAKLLIAAPDVMLLDEPSNHLDIATTQWLEGYLSNQPQAMVIVSHDRYFLNKVTNKTAEMFRQKLTVYPGNYQQYQRLRQERYEHQIKEYEAQREYIEKQEEYIRRVHYGQLSKQAQSRAKALEKLERVEAPVLISGPKMTLGTAGRAGDVVFSAHDLSKAYGDKVLFRNFSFAVPRGKRLGIMGPNGSGKTTLLRILLGEEEPTAGEVRRGHLVDVGYLDQHLALLPADLPVIRAVWSDPDPDLDEQKMRDLLGRFGLQGDIVFQPVGKLSGGERSRAALARLVVQGVNVMVLDEPTNHLDIWACESLEQAIGQYDGTVIVVSHDRYLLNRVADLLIVIEDGRTELVHGNYDTYELLRAARQAAEAEAAAKKAAKAGPPPPPRAQGSKPPKPKRKFPYRKIADIETDIAAKESAVRKYEDELAGTEIYRDANKLRDTMKAFEDAKAELAKLYDHWEEAAALE